jgi:hypothetical protein
MAIVESVNGANFFLCTSKKGFIYIFKGVDSNFQQPFRMMVNMGMSEAGKPGMELVIEQLHVELFKLIPIEKFRGLSLREVTEKYEFKNAGDYCKSISKEEQEEFFNFFGPIESFKQRPVIGFRNSKGIEYL